MESTSPSLLQRLKSDKPANADWQRFNDLYEPFLRKIFREEGLKDFDCDDLIQKVLLVWSGKVKTFDRKGHGRLRNWLKRTAANFLYEFWREGKKLGKQASFENLIERLEDEKSDLSIFWDKEHQRTILEHATAVVQGEFSDKDWQAFKLHKWHGERARDVAIKLGMSEDAVFVASSRVLGRMKQIADEMGEDI